MSERRRQEKDGEIGHLIADKRILASTWVPGALNRGFFLDRGR